MDLSTGVGMGQGGEDGMTVQLARTGPSLSVSVGMAELRCERVMCLMEKSDDGERKQKGFFLSVC